MKKSSSSSCVVDETVPLTIGIDGVVVCTDMYNGLLRTTVFVLIGGDVATEEDEEEKFRSKFSETNRAESSSPF